jgi:photosystem II stability/assembly factor-like uncharacterized protein
LNPLKIASLILALALLTSGCQELSVAVEPASVTASAPALASVAAGTAVPAASAVPPASAPPPTAIPGHLQPGASVRIAEIAMRDANQGWAIGNRGLGLQDAILRSADGGLTWRDVTPPLPPATTGAGRQAAAAFVDAQHAWVTYADPTPDPDLKNPAVWSTADGGQTWRTGQPLDMQGVNAESYSPAEFGFLDLQHGWLLAHIGAGMNHDYVVIFTTADGGQTWTRIVDPQKNNLPMSCQKTGLLFQTPLVGYVTGDCQGVASGIYFVRSVDSGATWQDVFLAPPADKPDLFTNQNSMCGVETILFPSPQDALVPIRCSPMGDAANAQRWLYTSQDGGQTFHPLPVPTQYGTFDFLDPQTGWLIGSFAADATRFTLFTTVDGGQNWRTLANLGWTGRPDFVDSQNGWVIARSADTTALVRTADGGATWQEIKPHVAP